MDVKKFYELSGSDYQAALSIMMSDVLIERMIQKFMSANAYASIIKAYEKGDIKEVFALAHSFKGVTGNLALTGLFAVASDLTEATRNKEEADIDNEIERLKAAYRTVTNAYDALAK